MDPCRAAGCAAERQDQLNGIADTDSLRDAIENLQVIGDPGTPLGPDDTSFLYLQGKRHCTGCHVVFTPRQGKQEYCTAACRGRFHNIFAPSWNPGVPPGTMGAIGELRVSTDLMMRGFEVFRAMSPCASCDLIVIKDGRQLRVEVRTATRNIDGSRYRQARPPAKDAGRQDVYAWVLPDKIEYEPPLEGA